MVQKLQTSEYLTRYGDMTTGERQAYEERVGEWLKSGAPALEARTDCFEARLQNVLQLSGGWNDQECQAFEEGARLLSALMGTGETWLPDLLYVKAAKRSVGRIIESLETAVAPLSGDDVVEDDGAKEEPAEGTGKATQAVAPFQDSAGDGDLAGGHQDGEAEVTPAPVRPKHIDQYAHLLPQKTQERAAQVKDLLRELDEAREKMRLLMDDPTAKDDDREAWAKKATSIDNKVRKIYEELDAEWEKLVKSGRVIVDDLGNARVVEVKSEEAKGEDPSDVAEEPSELTSEQRARRRSIRKWLVDTRRGNGDGENRADHVVKWHENFEELRKYDGDKVFEDEKVMAAAKHYGIDLSSLKDKTSETVKK